MAHSGLIWLSILLTGREKSINGKTQQSEKLFSVNLGIIREMFPNLQQSLHHNSKPICLSKTDKLWPEIQFSKTFSQAKLDPGSHRPSGIHIIVKYKLNR